MTERAKPDDLELAVTFGHLDQPWAGEVLAQNVSDRVVRLDGKPTVVLLDPDGASYGNQHVVTLEMLMPGYVDVPPGGIARADIAISSWDGRALGTSMIIGWQTARAVVAVDWPADMVGDGDDLWTTSGWWSLA